MNEFELIDCIVAELGDAASADWVLVGPGDDAAVTAVPAGSELVSSIDALVGGVHFPLGAAAELIGYRAIMVSASDLAAMGAAQGLALVALSLEHGDPSWVRGLARGMARAARAAGLRIVGGNIARGPLTLAISVHGYVPAGGALLRSGARPGDEVFVTGSLGAAAAAVARGGLDGFVDETQLDDLARRYFLPQARMAEGVALRGRASSVIDLSDGLLQDLGHICRASGVGVALESASIPVATGASLEQALSGGDDYELCFTVAGSPPALAVPVQRIGRVVAEPGVRLDGRAATGGYQHFSA
ncbi:MAG: thiamine-phosphate kinase [Pseudomonadales bacterium]